jgi:hypothetical protein
MFPVVRLFEETRGVEEKKGRAVCQWLTPVILVTQEAEIRKITVQNQPGKTVKDSPSQKRPITRTGW